MGGKRGRAACGGQHGHGGTPRLGALEGPSREGARPKAWLVRDSGGSGTSEGRDRSLESCFPWPQDQKAHRPPWALTALRRETWEAPLDCAPSPAGPWGKVQLGPKALTPLLSRKARPEGFVKSNKDSKQGFFFSSTWGKRNKESDAAAPLSQWVPAAGFPGAAYLPGQ